jgi:GT2 family glycosyltransferase
VNIQKSDIGKTREPLVWAVTLGFNNAGDTVECLQKLAESNYGNMRLMLVDNGSSDGTVAEVAQALPSVKIVKIGRNIGFAAGFNVGIQEALSQGADYVFMINNDTVVSPDLVAGLVSEGEGHLSAGIIVPKIFYHDHPDVVWSAGSRYRPFPPAIILRRTKGPDDGRYDSEPELEFATTCALLLKRQLLVDVGLLDTNFFFYCEDYDLCIRAREAGYSIRFVPGAVMRHKVSMSTKAGSRNPFFWETYGRSEAIFCRKHRKRRWMTGWFHVAYIVARFVFEGKYYGLVPFMKGFSAGRRQEIRQVPMLNSESVDGAECREGALQITEADG